MTVCDFFEIFTACSFFITSGRGREWFQGLRCLPTGRTVGNCALRLSPDILAKGTLTLKDDNKIQGKPFQTIVKPFDRNSYHKLLFSQTFTQIYQLLTACVFIVVSIDKFSPLWFCCPK